MKFRVGKFWAYINFAILLIAVVITKKSEFQYIVLAFPLFLLPFSDPQWSPVKSIFQLKRTNFVIFILLVVLVAAPVVLNMITMGAVFAILLYSALPEEWFFRVYLLNRLGNDTQANIISSLLFCSLHAIDGNFIHAALVFIPSATLGYVFLKRGNLWLIVSLHLLFNVVYTAFGLKGHI